ncbi:MAG: hypothetical protein EXQ56_13210 [Acidobacteria bacterium]|nr:hypothetical protein [Acidobacteriota bacterium]
MSVVPRHHAEIGDNLMSSLKSACVRFALILLVVGIPLLAQAQQALVLEGARLIDGTGRAPVEDSVVVISAGKILAAGARGAVSIPQGATVRQLAGKTIIPGLVDSHVHFRNFHAPFYLYWGVTSVGDMGNPRGWILAEKQAVASGRATGPFIMTVGHMVNMPTPAEYPADLGERNGYNPAQWLAGNLTRDYIPNAAAADAVIGEAKRLGADGVKLYTWLSPERLKETAAIAHKHGLPAFAHYTTANRRVGLLQGTDEILDTGIDLHVHMYGLIKATAPREVNERIEKGEAILPWDQLDTAKFPPLIQKMIERRMMLNPTLGAQFSQGSKSLSEFEQISRAFLDGPMAVLLPKETLANYQTSYRRRQPAPPIEEGFRRMGVFIKEFVNRGGKVAAGADTGPNVNVPGLTMHVEMQLLQEAGLTPMQVIQAATSWGMEAWRKGKEAGTLEPGKRADLVVLNRNPLEDISATRDIDQVIQAGKIIDRAALVNWKNYLPRPTPEQTGPVNTLIQTPFINEVSPERVALRSAGKLELVIRGDRFTPDCRVLFNDQLVPAKFLAPDRLTAKVRLRVKAIGTYPVAVVNPGSGGGVSNTAYIVVSE